MPFQREKAISSFHPSIHPATHTHPAASAKLIIIILYFPLGWLEAKNNSAMKERVRLISIS
jgi:hypothetical protein